MKVGKLGRQIRHVFDLCLSKLLSMLFVFLSIWSLFPLFFDGLNDGLA